MGLPHWSKSLHTLNTTWATKACRGRKYSISAVWHHQEHHLKTKQNPNTTKAIEVFLAECVAGHNTQVVMVDGCLSLQGHILTLLANIGKDDGNHHWNRHRCAHKWWETFCPIDCWQSKCVCVAPYFPRNSWSENNKLKEGVC